MTVRDAAAGGRVVAIDFGTAYSSAATIMDGRPQPIKERIENRPAIPSSVLLTADGELVVGYAAEHQKLLRPEAYETQFKQKLGQPGAIPLGDRSFRAEELVAEILRFLKAQAEESGGPIHKAVLTVPAAYGTHREQAMEQAGTLAGFNTVTLLKEPVAAAMLRPSATSTATERILVYDLGGGTFDAALVEFHGHQSRVVRYDGETTVGGVYIDRAIERDFADQAGPLLDEALAPFAQPGSDAWTVARQTELEIRDACRRLKHQLSYADSAEAIVRVSGGQLRYRLSRTRLAELIHGQLTQTLACCRRLLEGSKTSPDDVDTIMLVGGSCHLPMVESTLARGLGRPLQRVNDPELAVCLGAALYAYDHALEVSRQRDELQRLAAQREIDIGRAEAELRREARLYRQRMHDITQRTQREQADRLERNRETLRDALAQSGFPGRLIEYVPEELRGDEELVWLTRCAREPDGPRDAGLLLTTRQLIHWWRDASRAGWVVRAAPWAAIEYVRKLDFDAFRTISTRGNEWEFHDTVSGNDLRPSDLPMSGVATVDFACALWQRETATS